MADWRQIQARIRKAKNSQDPQAKLYELFQRTRDGMVAWELGTVEEKAGRNEEAARWYTTAAQRFRRADWKKKAEDALTRLGVELPIAEPVASSAAAVEPSPSAATNDVTDDDSHETQQRLAIGEIPPESDEPENEAAEPVASVPSFRASAPPSPGGMTGDADRKKRRRGRRGGRGRRRKGLAGSSPALPAQSFAEPTPSSPVSPESSEMHPPATRYEAPSRATVPAVDAPRHTHIEPPAPQLPSERSARGRGDPALASRMAQLESMLRRLLSSQLHKVDETDDAPAGPGVFLLSDSDQITSYYVEACQTLRVGLGNLVRGGRNARGPRGSRSASDTNLKAKLAEHLEISEAKVGQYLKEHCVVRWIQLDDDAPHLAHFAIGVLRTPLNAD